MQTPRNIDNVKTQNAGSPKSLGATARLFNRDNWPSRSLDLRESARTTSDMNNLSFSWTTWGEKGFEKPPLNTWEASYKKL